MTEQGEYGIGSQKTTDQYEFIAWSRRMFDSIAVGGQWAVPRSGLIFTKDSETQLRLVALVDEFDRFETENGIDVTTDRITLELQWQDYSLIKGYMEMAGITVLNDTNLESQVRSRNE